MRDGTGTEDTVGADAMAATAQPTSDPLAATEPPTDHTLPAPTGPAPTDVDRIDLVRPSLYVDRKVLSSGGMGRIFTARDRRLKRTVAIKELHTQNAELTGAEAILRLRALRTSGDFDDYWQFHLAQEHDRVHRSRYADGEVPNPLPRERPRLRLVK